MNIWITKFCYSLVIQFKYSSFSIYNEQKCFNLKLCVCLQFFNIIKMWNSYDILIFLTIHNVYFMGVFISFQCGGKALWQKLTFERVYFGLWLQMEKYISMSWASHISVSTRSRKSELELGRGHKMSTPYSRGTYILQQGSTS